MKLKKIILLILLFVLFLLLCNSKVYATISFQYNGKTYTCPDLPASDFDYQIVFFRYANSKTYYFNFYETNVIPLDYYSNYNGNSYALVHSGSSIRFRGSLSVNGGSWSVSTNGSPIAVTITEGVQPSNIVYANYNVDLVNYSTNVSTRVYTLPENYDNLPYFLNSDEDIALGEQDLIIMPRRFSK